MDGLNFKYADADDAKQCYELAEKFRNMAELYERLGKACEDKDAEQCEEVMKDLMWNMMKLQTM